MSPFVFARRLLGLSNYTNVLMVQPTCFAGMAYFKRAVSCGGDTSRHSCVCSKNVVAVFRNSLGIILCNQVWSSQIAEMYYVQYLNGLRNQLRLSDKT